MISNTRAQVAGAAVAGVIFNINVMMMNKMVIMINVMMIMMTMMVILVISLVMHMGMPMISKTRAQVA